MHSIYRYYRLKPLGVAVLSIGICHGVSAQNFDGDEIEEIIVKASGSRLPDSLEMFPGSVTVLDASHIENQRAVNTDVAQLLAVEVPGFSAGTSGSLGNFGQTLRGRKPAILIDGIPVSAPLRDGFKDFRTIDISAVSQVEVIRGSSALYGNGGAGGVINYITGRPGEGSPSFSTEAGFSVSLIHPDRSLRPSLRQTAKGRSGQFDYHLAGYQETVDAIFDADGDQIAPEYTGAGGMTDSTNYNLFSKFGYNWGEHRLQVSAMVYDQQTGMGWHAEGGDVAAGKKAVAVPGPADPRAEPTGSNNRIINVVYSGLDIIGTSVRVQGYHQDYTQTFDYSSVRFGGSQTLIESEKLGFRLDLNTPFDTVVDGGRILWGVDFTNDTTSQRLTDGRIWVPNMDQDMLGLFAQASLPLGDRFLIQAGVRHEDVGLDVDSFTTLGSGLEITGGHLDYKETVFNGGLSFNVAQDVTVFTAYSQGFSLADIGRVFRSTSDPGTVNSINPEAQIIDNYEVGVRTVFNDNVKLEASAFFSKSDLGTIYGFDPDNPGVLIVRRQAEEIKGFELAASATLDDDWLVGGTVSWVEGKRDTDGDGDVDSYMTGDRIQPGKLTVYVEKDISSRWSTRVQGLYSATRDKFPGGTGFGENKQESFFLVDLSVKGEIGPGILSIGINNLLNHDYFPPTALLFEGRDYTKGQGTSASVRYQINY